VGSYSISETFSHHVSGCLLKSLNELWDDATTFIMHVRACL